MSALSITSSAASGESVIVLARLLRLLGEVEELNRQLDRIDAQWQETLRPTVRDGFEDYR